MQHLLMSITRRQICVLKVTKVFFKLLSELSVIYVPLTSLRECPITCKHAVYLKKRLFFFNSLAKSKFATESETSEPAIGLVRWLDPLPPQDVPTGIESGISLLAVECSANSLLSYLELSSGEL